MAGADKYRGHPAKRIFAQPIHNGIHRQPPWLRNFLFDGKTLILEKGRVKGKIGDKPEGNWYFIFYDSMVQDTKGDSNQNREVWIK
jgi:hypothetical protein